MFIAEDNNLVFVDNKITAITISVTFSDVKHKQQISTIGLVGISSNKTLNVYVLSGIFIQISCTANQELSLLIIIITRILFLHK